MFGRMLGTGVETVYKAPKAPTFSLLSMYDRYIIYPVSNNITVLSSSHLFRTSALEVTWFYSLPYYHLCMDTAIVTSGPPEESSSSEPSDIYEASSTYLHSDDDISWEEEEPATKSDALKNFLHHFLAGKRLNKWICLALGSLVSKKTRQYSNIQLAFLEILLEIFELGGLFSLFI